MSRLNYIRRKQKIGLWGKIWKNGLFAPEKRWLKRVTASTCPAPSSSPSTFKCLSSFDPTATWPSALEWTSANHWDSVLLLISCIIPSLKWRNYNLDIQFVQDQNPIGDKAKLRFQVLEGQSRTFCRHRAAESVSFHLIHPAFRGLAFLISPQPHPLIPPTMGPALEPQVQNMSVSTLPFISGRARE